jgi:hypothetical protein
MALKLYDKLAHALRWFLLRRLPTCKEMVVVMSESLERPLTMRERVLLRLHLWVCMWCVWYLEQLRLLRESLRMQMAQGIIDKPSAISLSAEARDRIKRALNRSAF